MKNKKFWVWKNQTDADPGAERVLELNGTIAEESWYDDDVTPQMFRDELFAGSGDIIIWINSPGGDCVAASQIYSMLMDYKGNVTVKIDGIAASAASPGDSARASPMAKYICLTNASSATKKARTDGLRSLRKKLRLFG